MSFGQFQKISIPTPLIVIGNSEWVDGISGGVGEGRGGGSNQKTICKLISCGGKDFQYRGMKGNYLRENKNEVQATWGNYSIQGHFGPPHFHVLELFKEWSTLKEVLLLCNGMQIHGPVFYRLASSFNHFLVVVVDFLVCGCRGSFSPPLSNMEMVCIYLNYLLAVLLKVQAQG